MNKPVDIYEQVRELVKDPQHGSKDYGALGHIPQQYRHMIHRLCDYAESMDKMIMKVYKTNMQLANELFTGKFPDKYAVITVEELEQYVLDARELKRIKRELLKLTGVRI